MQYFHSYIQQKKQQHALHTRNLVPWYFQTALISVLDHSESLENKGNIESNYNNPLFIGEDALFNMSGLLESMAEGMLLTPPAALQREKVDWDNYNIDDTADTCYKHKVPYVL